MIIIPQHSNKQKGLYFPLCSKSRTMVISFDETFIYEGKNQTDLHKVFGIGLFCFGSFKTGKNKRWWELHKWISLRLGARWNKELQCVEVTDYAYVEGVGERNTTDNQILQIKAHKEESKRDKLLCKIAIESKGLSMIATNLNTLKTINVFIPCKIPLIYLCLRLRAYMQNLYRTQDVFIHN